MINDLKEATKRVLSERELATELGISPWTARLWRLQLGMPHFRTAGRIFYRLESVLAWMTEQEKSDKPNEDFGYGQLRNIK